VSIVKDGSTRHAMELGRERSAKERIVMGNPLFPGFSLLL
jgi:hypothetical protein